MSASIPFNRPAILGNEERYIKQAVANGHLSGDGPFTKACAELLEHELGVERALLTSSCTDALELAGLLLDLEPGDEIVVPSFTFVSTANAFVLRGARPVFVDVRPDTLNLDETLLADAITTRTRAVVPVHYAGVGCEMDAIGAVCGPAGVTVVEDNAHGLFGRYRGRPLGTFGTFSTQSFHETKNFTCGEGGALLVNDRRFVERAEILREKGTNRAQFKRGQVDKYTWVDVGSSFLPSDLAAAFLLAQLERRAEVQDKRRQLWERYATALAPWAAEWGVRLPVVPEHCEQAFHMFHLVAPTAADRTHLIEELGRRDILAVFHYVPLHLSPMGERFGYQPGACPVTEDVSARLVRLPFFTDMAAHEQDRVIDAVAAISLGR